jgi:2-polyprenyl-3-methyl-5-hydroxy-6-metoxy-1,4-benzoquinol methylase
MEDGRGVTDESYDASLLTSGPQGNVGWQVIDGAWKVYLEGDIGGWRTLDIGTGFGPIPMELATLAPVEAVGVDVDATVVQQADHMRVKVEGPFSSSDSCRRGAR